MRCKLSDPRIEFVRTFIKENSIQSVVDLGCGDWQFSPYIYHDLGVDYVGYDVVLPVIQESLDHHLSSMIAQLRIMILLTIGAAIQSRPCKHRFSIRRCCCFMLFPEVRLLLVAFLLLVMPFAPSSVLVPRSKARSPSSVLTPSSDALCS